MPKPLAGGIEIGDENPPDPELGVDGLGLRGEKSPTPDPRNDIKAGRGGIGRTEGWAESVGPKAKVGAELGRGSGDRPDPDPEIGGLDILVMPANATTCFFKLSSLATVAVSLASTVTFSVRQAVNSVWQT